MAAGESELINLIIRRGFYYGMRLFRNNVGRFKARSGRSVSCGLCKGASDIIGWYQGRFTAIEVKTKTGGKLSSEQQRFLSDVRQSGGIALCVKSFEDFESQIQTAII